MNSLSQEIREEESITSLPEGKRKDFIRRFERMLFQALLVRSLDILSLEEEEELDALLDTDATTPEDILGFLKAKIPTFDLLMREEKQRLKEKVISGTLV